ncbi:phosphatidylinositol 4-phosphate 5-kinase 9-like isoform X2 [Tasmannia lanceolata]|uniref:phosphatidylinositol 4-phosphate 5-kinase 9-like isoform X2 n=1 Tax=Tasmannia lanceolata TaxID=3420 RepID=UPI0040644333
MSGPVALVDDANGALSSVGSTSLSHDTSCASANGQVNRSSSESVGFRSGELVLPNGESYSGTLCGNIPEGSGRYVWSDGCIYEGEWSRGMKNGNGKLSWPFGAVYMGEFSGGYMHGTGTLVGPDKMTYKGRWRLNLKHGLGFQTFPNGDEFEGSWIQGVIEGPGKYVWADGNVYIGNMKGGEMSGKGCLTWTNGDSFEGSWLDGMMHGFGVYTWDDGGYYVGIWTRGLKDGKGAFYPKGGRLPAVQELYLNALRKRGLLPDLKKQNYGGPRTLRSSVDMGNIKVREKNRSNRDSSESVIEGDEREADTNAPILEREYMQGVLISELVINDSFSSLSRKARKRNKRLTKGVKRPGEIIIKGHRSYDLMLSLQLGIRYTVGKITPIQRREVRASDFGRQASFWKNFPKDGSLLTPPHQSEDFKWKDYCPVVFRNLREMFKIDAGDYMMSICGNDALRELSSPGKSGSVFFLSQDDRFMIKTLRKSEVQVLLRMLPKYHHHVRTYENTLITKFFGLHRVKPSSGQKFRFVVMGNMFCTELRIHRRFDLKGSSLGRSTNKVEIDENTTLKDLDLNYCFYLEPSWRDSLLKQIEIDSKFLESQCIMDYSLLMGVHYRAPQHLLSFISFRQNVTSDGLPIVAEDEEMPDAQEDEISNYPQGVLLVPRRTSENSVVVGPHIRGSRLRASAAGDEEVDLLLPGTARLQIQLGVNMPARAEHIPNKEKAQLLYEVYDVVLYLGIIDILQDYDMGKKIEHAYKSFQFDSFSISAVNPTHYSERFLQFIQKVFPENS